MWPFKKKKVKKEIIYDNTVYVEAYAYPNHYDVPIVTYVVKTTKGNKVKFELICDYSLNDSAFLTSEHASNGRISQTAKGEQAKAKKIIEEYKCRELYTS